MTEITFEICVLHNLGINCVCLGEQCSKRLGCPLCIGEHSHKFHLDSKTNTKPVLDVRREVIAKTNRLWEYTNHNLKGLGVGSWKQIWLKKIAGERIYLESKLLQERKTFEQQMDKLQSQLTQTLDNLETELMDQWKTCQDEIDSGLAKAEQYKEMGIYFQKGNWQTNSHLEESLSQLYSEELLLRFNQAFDRLKIQFQHHRRQSEQAFDWLEGKRKLLQATQLSGAQKCKQLMGEWKEDTFKVIKYTEEATKAMRQAKEEPWAALGVGKGKRQVLIYPKVKYDVHQPIHRLLRYDNQLFITTGGRAVCLWSHTGISKPEKQFPSEYPSYGACIFKYGTERTQVTTGANRKSNSQQSVEAYPYPVLYGLSDGSLGLIDLKTKQNYLMNAAHSGTIRQIVQADQFHFVTASHDYTVKLWAMAEESQYSGESTTGKGAQPFALQRGILRGHSGRIYSMTMFGPSLLSAGFDGTIKQWDIYSLCEDTSYSHTQEVYSLCELSPSTFVSGGEFKKLLLWDYRTPKLPCMSVILEHGCYSMLRYDSSTVLMADRHAVRLIDMRMGEQRAQESSVYRHAIWGMDYLSDAEVGMGGSEGFITVWKY